MKKLYSTLFFVSLLFTISKATIHYVSVDQTVGGTGRSYDMDFDGSTDFYFECGTSCNVHSPVSTSLFANEGTNGTLPKAYAIGEVMDTFNWHVGSGMLEGPGSTGNFFNVINKYLMVKFSDGTHTYYGWFLISDYFLNLSIISYAYSDVPGEILSPGQTTTLGHQETTIESSIILSPNPAKDQLFIAANGAEIEQVNIYNSTGSLVMTVLPTISICQLSTGSLPTGLYIAEIKTKEGMARKRWVKM